MNKAVVAAIITALAWNAAAQVQIETGTLAQRPLPTQGRLFGETGVAGHGLWLAHSNRWYSVSPEVVNVKDFGAVGDGRNPDGAAIQAAIDSVIPPAPPAGYENNDTHPCLQTWPWIPNGTCEHKQVIYFPRGTYKIDRTLIVRAHQRLTFMGPAVAAGSYTAAYIIQTDPNKDIIDASTELYSTFSVANIGFQGTGEGTGSGHGIVLGRHNATAFDSRIENCWFVMIPQAAIRAWRIQGYHINNNAFEGSNYGLWIDNGSYMVIQNNRFYQNSLEAIHWNLGVFNQIQGNTFDQNGTDLQDGTDSGAAILVANTTTDENRELMIANNLFTKNRNDIVLQGNSNAYAAQPYGITNTFIHGNTSDFAERRFLVVNGAANTVVANNRINDNSHGAHLTYPAIHIAGVASGTLIFGNVQTDQSAPTATHGLVVDSTVTNTTIGINTFTGGIAPVSLGGTYRAAQIHGPLRLGGSTPAVSTGELGLGGETSTTVGAAGSAAPLPGAPAGYLIVNIGGTNYKVPYYPQ